MSILDDGSLATTLTDALSAFDIPMACTITRMEESGPPFDPVITPVDHACMGWIDNYTQLDHVDSAVQINDRKAFVLCSSLDITPTTADQFKSGGVSYVIVNVQRDPAGAAWVIQARA
ncbi:hypothetical protein SAMN05216338_104665 [Bradyrhizobium sp. Rc2d]|uniref:hypothetical protein n=1 Tax=Bradyrhizobium sp. Rc2d TaxID=1855321 RepID=UPI0008915D42|nr:hypothetical protein [Bradyrhizobium sp. Rc2d]SDJ34082.1 hypothetical protein SAMN05216338_104665 [Bradyrhizobium sp. Rc2d]